MMRSFLTRFPNSLIGVVLLVLCLWIGLACSTPRKPVIPGMTQDEVRALEAARRRAGMAKQVVVKDSSETDQTQTLREWMAENEARRAEQRRWDAFWKDIRHHKKGHTHHHVPGHDHPVPDHHVPDHQHPVPDHHDC